MLRKMRGCRANSRRLRPTWVFVCGFGEGFGQSAGRCVDAEEIQECPKRNPVRNRSDIFGTSSLLQHAENSCGLPKYTSPRNGLSATSGGPSKVGRGVAEERPEFRSGDESECHTQSASTRKSAAVAPPGTGRSSPSPDRCEIEHAPRAGLRVASMLLGDRPSIDTSRSWPPWASCAEAPPPTSAPQSRAFVVDGDARNEHAVPKDVI